MSLQYISDEAGNHKAVIIPIKEWNEIMARHEDIKEITHQKTVISQKKPSDYMGTLDKTVGMQMLADIEKDREE